MDAYRRGVAAILKKIGADAIMCCGHKEYAPARKIDPTFDMNDFRQGVTAILTGTSPPLALIPAIDEQNRPTLRRGDRNPLVERIQQIVGVAVDGIFGPGTEAAVREFQRNNGMVPDGIVGPKTWAAIDT